MTNKTTKTPTTKPSTTEFQQILSATGKLTQRMVFVLVLTVVVVSIFVFGVMYFVYSLSIGTRASDQFLWSFVIIALAVGILAGVLLSIWYTNIVTNAIRPYFSVLDRIGKGDFSKDVTDENELLKGTFVAENFNNMVKSLRSVETLREGFISDFSHEFKTPIVSISGFAKLLKTADLTEEERNEYLDVIINESDRLVNLSQSVLMLSRLDDQVVETKPFLLDEQLRQSVLLFDKALKDKNIHLDLFTEQLPICSSQQLLSNVWINLINNAIKFSPNNSKVEIVAKKQSQNVVVTVTDQGCGIDEDAQQHIFNKFYQCDKSHSIEGNGLGLAIVQKVLNILGGSVQVKSALGQGSTFTVTLPIGNAN